jgi:hypothetical protein
MGDILSRQLYKAGHIRQLCVDFVHRNPPGHRSLLRQVSSLNESHPPRYDAPPVQLSKHSSIACDDGKRAQQHHAHMPQAAVVRQDIYGVSSSVRQ